MEIIQVLDGISIFLVLHYGELFSFSSIDA
jgi:hypothetical protein